MPVAQAVDVAPHISDREIIERLTRLEEGQTRLNQRFESLERQMNQRFEGMEHQMNQRFDDLNRHFDTLQWMIGLFMTISLVIFGAM